MQQEVLNIDKNVAILMIKALNTSTNNREAIQKLGTNETNFYRKLIYYGLIEKRGVWIQKSPCSEGLNKIAK